MNNEIYLWDVLNISREFNSDDVDNAYAKLKDKTLESRLAWKVLRDKFYCDVYKKYLNLDTVIKAGFFEDNLAFEDVDYYNLNLLTTPVGKILDNIKIKGVSRPIVLLTTGGFYPLHEGHMHMMEAAKKELEKNGYDVVGGYFSPSHADYVSTKPYYKHDEYERLEACQSYVKDSDWLMVDPWESIYVKTCINFTDVYKRLEAYLKLHVDKNIKVAYVFGGDNAGFMHCFANNGIGVCVERDGFNEEFAKMKKQMKGNNTFFIDNKTKEAAYSSREIRKLQINKCEESGSEMAKGVYGIRNELTAPLLNYRTNGKEEKIKKAQEGFLEEFVLQLQEVLGDNLTVKVINMIEQLKNVESALNGKKTISLDSYFKGTHNIEASRLFHISDIQNKYITLTERIGRDTIKNQIKKIEAGSYVLVDDDSVTGKTIKEIMSYLPDKIKIEQIYLLTSILKEEIFDIVDLRDFIIGAQNGGLVVRLPNGDAARAPYMMPYVSLKSRANIPVSKQMQFSIKLWEMNKKLINFIDGNIKLSQTECGFKKLMNYVGFEDDTPLVDICDWHIEKLRR